MGETLDTQVVVLGGGPAGYSAAFRAADLGLEVRRELRHAPVRRAVVHLFVLGAPDYGSVWISETTPGRASAGRAGSWTAVGRGWNRRGGSRGCWEKNGRVKTRTLARARPK